MRFRIGKISRKYALIMFAIGLALIGASLALLFFNAQKVQIPKAITSQLNYKAIYPSSNGSAPVPTDYVYKADENSLTFSTTSPSGVKITIVEQPAPDSLGSDGQVYYPALGIHPYAQFQSKIGPVALTKFWLTGSLEPLGQTAILAAQGTMLVARPEKNLTNAEWKDFFDTLRIAK